MIFNAKSLMIPEGSVVKITDPNGFVLWSKGSEPVPVDYSKYPFFIENAGGDFNKVTLLKNNEDAYTANLQIGVPLGGKDDLSSIWWQDAFDTSTSGRSYSLAYKQRIYFRATGNVGYLTNANGNYNFFQSDDNVSVGGNIMSLAYNAFETRTSLSTSVQYNFNCLFWNMSKLVDASKLVLPATTLSGYCYQNLFSGCSSLTTAPALPAMTMKTYCYNRMFYNCSVLTTAPELPATTLATYCYSYMFYNCARLTTAPELPATTLATYCYQYMFYGCTRLTEAPVLPARNLTTRCYQYMFNNCRNLNKIVFYGYSSSSSTMRSTYLPSWVQGVASTGDFYNMNNTAIQNGTSGIPSGWTEHKNAELTNWVQVTYSFPTNDRTKRYNNIDNLVTVQTVSSSTNSATLKFYLKEPSINLRELLKDVQWARNVVIGSEITNVSQTGNGYVYYTGVTMDAENDVYRNTTLGVVEKATDRLVACGALTKMDSSVKIIGEGCYSSQYYYLSNTSTVTNYFPIVDVYATNIEQGAFQYCKINQINLYVKPTSNNAYLCNGFPNTDSANGVIHIKTGTSVANTVWYDLIQPSGYLSRWGVCADL